MALPPTLRRFRAAEYLTIERQSPFKSELVAGQMYAMTGASRAHNLIAVNIASELRDRLKGRPCETFANDMRVKSAADDDYFYPDVIVVCFEPHFEDDVLDTLLNPTVLFEILSSSTERYDQTAKFEDYTQIPSLAAYVLVAQDRPHVEVFRRDDGGWVSVAVDGLEASFDVPGLGCQLPMAEVYARVGFG